MLSYSKIIKQSYYITLRYKTLWLFGLFVVGSFNLSFFHFSVSKRGNFEARNQIQNWLNFFTLHPWVLFGLSLLVLIISIGGLILTNWCRIMLVLGTESVLKVKSPELREQAKKSGKFLWRIIKISLFTTSLMLLIALALLGPSVTILQGLDQQGTFVGLGVILFIPLAFVVSCLNIFTGFYVLLFGQNTTGALHLATDFVASKWVEILGMTLILVAIYAGVFVLGAAAIYLAKLLLTAIFEIGLKFGNSNFSAIIMVTRTIAWLFLWVLLAGLNVFFNTALQLLFLELNTPLKVEEPAKSPAVSPVTV